MGERLQDNNTEEIHCMGPGQVSLTGFEGPLRVHIAYIYIVGIQGSQCSEPILVAHGNNCTSSGYLKP